MQLVNKKAFLPLLLIILPLHAYGQIPEDYYEESQLYPNQKSNDELALSIDNNVYAKGDTVNVFGIVKDYSSGISIFIQVYDPDKKQILDLRTAAGNSGNFETPFKIPQDAIYGKYTVSAEYGSAGKTVSLEFSIISNENTVQIPMGSSTGNAKFNFTPKNTTVNYGAEITWMNNDDSLHTVVSGKVGLDKRMYADGLFDSGTFGPTNSFSRQFFKEGTYLYFCKLHPWLVGQIIVKPYAGPLDQKPVPPPEQSEPSEENLDDYLFITTQRHDLEFKKTLFNDDITSSFKTWRHYNNASDTITISDATDAKVGANSLRIQIETHAGDAAVFDDFSKEKLQDWSNYNHLSFLFKGQNSKQTIPVMIMNESRYLGVVHTITDDTSDWKKLQIQFYPNVNNIDLYKVRGLEFHFPQGTKGEFFIDDIMLANSAEQKIVTDKDTYIFGETIFVSGIVTNRESDSSPVTIKVVDPTQNIVTVKQVVPESDNTFSFTLIVSGNQFKKEGLYKIFAQYGLHHKTSTSFTILSLQLEEAYKGFGIYRLGNNAFYSILQKEGDLEINRVRSDQYSEFLAGDSLESLKQNIDKSTEVIPPGTQPVVQGNTSENLKPNETVLKTAEPSKLEEIIHTLQILAVITITIGGIIGYIFYKRTKKITRENSQKFYFYHF